MTESLDLGPAIRTAILADDAAGGCAELIAAWEGERSVHTRRPVPADATSPLVVINPPAEVGNADAIKAKRPSIVIDVVAYGSQPDQYRDAEALGFRLRALFHRQKEALDLTGSGFRVIELIASGPYPAPTDDDTQVARVVTLRVFLAEV